MSLREEIRFYYGKEWNPSIEEDINRILEMIEKRIDSTIEDIKRDIEFVSNNNLGCPSNSIEAYYIYRFKEMLKE